jgi:hypothetical protein
MGSGSVLFEDGGASKNRLARNVRWVGAILLFFVAYIHLGLVTDRVGLRGTLGILFLLNAIGAVVALIGILVNPSNAGLRATAWTLGLVDAGGAAVAKITMDVHPAFGRFLMGGFKAGRKGRGTGGNLSHSSPGASFGAGVPHGHGVPGRPAPSHVLPLLAGMHALGDIAIAIELAFALVAIVYFLSNRSNQNPRQTG